MWLVQADFLVLGLWSSGQVSTFYLLGANRYLVVVVVGLCQSLPFSITLTLLVARWNRVLTRVAIFNKGVVVQLVLNHTWWQRFLTLKMLDTAAVSHTQKTSGLPSEAQENEINPQQPSQLPLPASTPVWHSSHSESTKKSYIWRSSHCFQ